MKTNEWEAWTENECCMEVPFFPYEINIWRRNKCRLPLLECLAVWVTVKKWTLSTPTTSSCTRKNKYFFIIMYFRYRPAGLGFDNSTTGYIVTLYHNADRSLWHVFIIYSYTCSCLAITYEAIISMSVLPCRLWVTMWTQCISFPCPEKLCILSYALLSTICADVKTTQKLINDSCHLVIHIWSILSDFFVCLHQSLAQSSRRMC